MSETQPRNYCLFEAADEPGRQCHRPKGHYGSHSEFPMRGDFPTVNRNPDVGPDQPVVTQANGAKQSALPYRFDLLDSSAIFALAGVRYYGTDIRGYSPDNWKGISAESHLNHALSHIFAYLGGDKQDDHLAHAFCRLMFAVSMAKVDGG